MIITTRNIPTITRPAIATPGGILATRSLMFTCTPWPIFIAIGSEKLEDAPRLSETLNDTYTIPRGSLVDGFQVNVPDPLWKSSRATKLLPFVVILAVRFAFWIVSPLTLISPAFETSFGYSFTTGVSSAETLIASMWEKLTIPPIHLKS